MCRRLEHSFQAVVVIGVVYLIWAHFGQGEMKCKPTLKTVGLVGKYSYVTTSECIKSFLLGHIVK